MKAIPDKSHSILENWHILLKNKPLLRLIENIKSKYATEHQTTIYAH